MVARILEECCDAEDPDTLDSQLLARLIRCWCVVARFDVIAVGNFVCRDLLDCVDSGAEYHLLGRRAAVRREQILTRRNWCKLHRLGSHK